MLLTSSFAEILMVKLLLPLLNPSVGKFTDKLGGILSTRNPNKFVVETPEESVAVIVTVPFTVWFAVG